MAESVKTARARRFALIREAMGITQPEFVERLNAAAKSMGIDRRYTALGVSQRETGRKALDIEDYTVVSHVDPERRSWFWLAFGRELPAANLIPRPATVKRVAEGRPK